ncbi:TIGR03016 family PEP-CTERM system-associated outer membrane protein [Alteromonas sediminis]|nr:TIGR03016 family PEP-CTERM system-associated outer membrane protein [Alteromonas sediminis]
MKGRHLLPLAVMSLSPMALADFSFTADVESSGVFQDVKRTEQENQELASIIVEPGVSALYRSRKFNASVQSRYTFLEREINEDNRSDDYTEYTYNLAWTPLDRFLILSANGGLSYNNVNINSNIASDFLLNEDELSKTRSNRFAATVNLEEFSFLDATSTISYSSVTADRNEEFLAQGVDNKSLSANGTAQSKNNATDFIWQVNGDYSKTDRSASNSRDFESRQGSGFASYMVAPSWGITAVGQHEAYQIGRELDLFNTIREFNSIGIGVSYRQSATRVITITANKSDTDFESNDNDTFVGLDAEWAFSPRTKISASFGTRFYGDSANVNFTFNSKRIRWIASYSESVTTFSRLVSEPQSLGVFVCSAGSTLISDCFQPSSLSYELEAGEVFAQFTDPNFQIEDQVILRKALTSTIGFTGKRLSSQISLSVSNDEYVEIVRERDTVSASTSVGYKLGRNGKLSASVRYIQTEQTRDLDVNGESETWRTSINYRHALGRNLSTNIELSYLDRDNTDNTTFGGRDLEEKRINLSLKYKLK